MSHVEQESLLTRWSRRKLQSPEEAAEADRELEIVGEITTDEQSELAREEEQPVLTDADMPPIESLHEDSDFSVFMSSGVSDKLRNLALRKMFHLPAFNIRDGLDEYDEDFTTFEALGEIVTSDMKHQVEMQRKKKTEEEVEQVESELASGHEAPSDGDSVEDLELETDQDLSTEDQVEPSVNMTDAVEAEEA